MNEKYIDFHAHVLPEADHGSDGIETSRQQLIWAEAAGIGHIVATPHFYPERHSPKAFLERRERAHKRLLPFAGDIMLVIGAEVKLCKNLCELPELEKLTIGESANILIEMPSPPWNEREIDTLLRIKCDRGLKVILAHVERYVPEDIEELFGLGFKGQINASTINPAKGRSRYFRWIDEGHVVAVGSDVHGISNAYKDYSRAMIVLGGRGEKLQKSMYDLISI